MIAQKTLKNRSKFMQLIIPLLILSGLLFIGGSEYAKEKFTGLDILFSIMNSIGGSLFAGAAVTSLYNYFIKEIDISEMQLVLKSIFQNDGKVHKIIFFSPTLLQNEFYHEMLHQLIILSGELDRKMDVVVKLPSNLNDSSVKYHDNEDGYVHELSKIECDDNTIFVIVPCNPSFHTVIPHKLNNLRNIITLDMEVPGSYSDSFKENPCFLANIKTDNKDACKQIATRICAYINEKQLVLVNFIICEGSFHGRGRLFKEYIEKECADSGSIGINFIPEKNPLQELDFGNAIDQASNFVYCSILSVMRDEKLRLNHTFIFCANDNMGIGARNALIRAKLNFSSDEIKRQVIKHTKIICFDYSSTIKNFIENKDEFIYFSSGQNYIAFAQKIINIASRLDRGKREDLDKTRKEIAIPPLFEAQ